MRFWFIQAISVEEAAAIQTGGPTGPGNVGAVVLTGLTLVGASWDVEAHALTELVEGAGKPLLVYPCGFRGCVCRDYGLVCPGITSAMGDILLRPIASTDLDFDHDVVGVASKPTPSLATHRPSGLVGPGSVLGTPTSTETLNPEALPSYFAAGGRHHRVFTNAKMFACPVYTSHLRRSEDHVFDVWLPSTKPSQHWILRGVHLLL